MEFIWNIVEVISTVTWSTGKTVNDFTVFRTMTTTVTTTLGRINVITVFSTANVIDKSPGTTTILSIWIWRLFSVFVVFWISWSYISFSWSWFSNSGLFWWSISSLSVSVDGASISFSGSGSLNTTPVIVFNTPLLTIFFINNFSTILTTWEIW